MNQRPYKYFAIFGTMRSGSNLLEQSLNQYSNISCHGELFNPSFIGYPKSDGFLNLSMSDRERDPYSVIDAMVQNAGEGIAGFRIFQDHDQRAAKLILEDVDCAKIILHRNPLQSFISLGIARKTKQWLLRNAPQKRSSKITFNEKEYLKYRSEHEEYYTSIRKSLQASGQSAFWLHYPEQKEMATLNGISKFLGNNETLKSVKETIRRQNPGGFREKVENYDEMKAFLSKWDESEVVPATSPDPFRRANIPNMVTCISHPILFVPTPGGPNEEILRWMHSLDGGELVDGNLEDSVKQGDILHTGHSQRTLFEWMQSTPNVTALTAVRHPIPRAYEVFMEKIFGVGPGSYDAIRTQLIDSFDLMIPERKLLANGDREAFEAEGYDKGQHRAAFHVFLRFLKKNLDGQTSIRIDGLWVPQMSFLASFNSAVPISMICKEGRLDESFRYVEAKFDLPKPNLGIAFRPSYLFSLDEVYTQQTENLARKAYAIDYTRIGFDDYQAALDV